MEAVEKKQTMWMWCWENLNVVNMESTPQGWKCRCRQNCEAPMQNLEDTVYVNVYAVTRHYGGPEEGGWWYNAGCPVGSVLTGVEEIEKVKADLEKRYKDIQEGDIYSMRGGTAIMIQIEREFAQAWPEARPHYE